MTTRVNFEIKTTGTVNSYYVWVERKNVRLRNKKGYLMLKPRTTKYEVVYMAKGNNNGTAELIVTQGDKVLGKKKRKIGERRVISDSVSIAVGGAG